jgi:hypothetical protein
VSGCVGAGGNAGSAVIQAIFFTSNLVSTQVSLTTYPVTKRLETCPRMKGPESLASNEGFRSQDTDEGFRKSGQ